MFVPQTAHFGPRIYSSQHAPTTARRPKTLNNKENSHALPAKTPSRLGAGGGKDALLLGEGRGGGATMEMKQALGTQTARQERLGLGLKTVERNGGQSRGGPDHGNQEGLGKGKGKAGEVGEDLGLINAAPKRLFTSSKPISGSTSLSTLPSVPARPHGLSTRTPGPSRVLPLPMRTPAAPSRSFAQLPLELNEPAPTPLPSATRQRRRSRLSTSGSNLALQASSQTPLKLGSLSGSRLSGSGGHGEFKTPARGLWEEGESIEMTDLGEGGGGVEVKEGLKEVLEEEEEDGDVEYMPEPVEPLQWEPAWEQPDLGTIFDTFARQPLQFAVWEDERVRLDEPDISLIEAGSEELPELDEEAYEHPVLRKTKSKPMAKVQARVAESGFTAHRPIGTAVIRGGAAARTANSAVRSASTSIGAGRPGARPPVSGLAPLSTSRSALKSIPTNRVTSGSSSKLSRPEKAAPTSTLKMEVDTKYQELLDSLIPLSSIEDDFVLDLKL